MKSLKSFRSCLRLCTYSKVVIAFTDVHRLKENVTNKKQKQKKNPWGIVSSGLRCFYYLTRKGVDWFSVSTACDRCFGGNQVL